MAPIKKKKWLGCNKSDFHFVGAGYEAAVTS